MSNEKPRQKPKGRVAQTVFSQKLWDKWLAELNGEGTYGEARQRRADGIAEMRKAYHYSPR